MSILKLVCVKCISHVQICLLYTYPQSYPQIRLFIGIYRSYTTIQKDKHIIVRNKRIELLSHPWQGRILPLNQFRYNLYID